MNFFEYKAKYVEINETTICVTLDTGEKASLPISNFMLLKNATKEQLQEVEIFKGYALHWKALNEDLSVAGFFEKVEA